MRPRASPLPSPLPISRPEDSHSHSCRQTHMCVGKDFTVSQQPQATLSNPSKCSNQVNGAWRMLVQMLEAGRPRVNQSACAENPPPTASHHRRSLWVAVRSTSLEGRKIVVKRTKDKLYISTETRERVWF